MAFKSVTTGDAASNGLLLQWQRAPAIMLAMVPMAMIVVDVLVAIGCSNCESATIAGRIVVEVNGVSEVKVVMDRALWRQWLQIGSTFLVV